MSLSGFSCPERAYFPLHGAYLYLGKGFVSELRVYVLGLDAGFSLEGGGLFRTWGELRFHPSAFVKGHWLWAIYGLSPGPPGGPAVFYVFTSRARRHNVKVGSGA